jgi:hypothetical protein
MVDNALKLLIFYIAEPGDAALATVTAKYSSPNQFTDGS